MSERSWATKERDYAQGSLDIRMDLCSSVSLNLSNFHGDLLNEKRPYPPGSGLGWSAQGKAKMNGDREGRGKEK